MKVEEDVGGGVGGQQRHVDTTFGCVPHQWPKLQQGSFQSSSVVAGSPGCYKRPRERGDA